MGRTPTTLTDPRTSMSVCRSGEPAIVANSEVLEKLENSKTQKLDAARADNERTFVRVFALGVLEKLAKTPKTRENSGPVPGAGTPFAAA